MSLLSTDIAKVKRLSLREVKLPALEVRVEPITPILVEIPPTDEETADNSKAIELNPNYADAYYNRGVSKVYFGLKDSGCLDLSKAGELGSKNAFEAIKVLCN
jgi:hypothetical protein